MKGNSKQRRLRVAVVAALLVIAGTATFAVLGGSDDGPVEGSSEPKLTSTLIQQRELTEYLEITGTLDYEGSITLTARSDGALMQLAPEGTVVARGEQLYLLLNEPTDSEAADALRELAAARNALMVAEDQLSDAQSGPSEAEQASARADVAQAIEARDLLIAPHGDAEFRNAKAAVATAAETLELLDNPTAAARADARSRLTAAQDHLAQLSAGASKAEIDSAEANLLAAREELAELLADPTEAEIDSAEANLLAAREELAELLADPTEAEVASAEATVQTAQEMYFDELHCCGNTNESDELEAALLRANEALAELLAGPTESEIGNAEARVLTAQDAHDDLLAGASQTEIGNAEARVLTAQEARDDVLAGASRTEMEDAEAAVLAAQEALDLLDNPTEASRERARADLATANEALADLLAGPTDAEIDAANAAILVAQDVLAELTAEPAAAELRSLADSVSSARAELRSAEAAWATLDEAQHSLVIMYGSTPGYRTMAVGTEGEDVRQLQENLVELGAFDSDGFSAHGSFDEATAAAVRRWQESVGHSVDTTVSTADVLFVSGPVQVGTWDQGIELGQDLTVGRTLASLTAIEVPTDDGMSTTQRVLAELPLSDRDLVTEGITVNVELPDGTDVAGTVTAISSSPIVDNASGDNFVEVAIRLASPASPVWIGASVDVEIDQTVIDDALVVPATALVALVEGGSAVEILNDDGSTSLVGVETGLFVDGDVEVISGDLRPGMSVIVPR